jgi:hypothetical protein
MSAEAEALDFLTMTELPHAAHGIITGIEIEQQTKTGTEIVCPCYSQDG